jgi:hypothetical protein
LCSAAGLAQGQTKQEAHKSEPSTFYPDDENRGFDEATLPSNTVLDALLKTHEAKENWDRLKTLDRERLRKLFLVSKVHLAESGETDEVVLGSDPMSGADCYWFWIVRDKGERARVLLFTNNYGIDLLNTRTNGYREIRGVWSSAAGYSITRLYRYDGSRYRLAYERTHQELPPKAKP